MERQLRGYSLQIKWDQFLVTSINFFHHRGHCLIKKLLDNDFGIIIFNGQEKSQISAGMNDVGANKSNVFPNQYSAHAWLQLDQLKSLYCKTRHYFINSTLYHIKPCKNVIYICHIKEIKKKIQCNPSIIHCSIIFIEYQNQTLLWWKYSSKLRFAKVYA